MPEETPRKQKEEQLALSLTRCLVISDEDRKFWLGQIPTLPEAMMDKVFQSVESKNAVMDKYLEAALAEDKDHKYLTELKEKIKNIKEKAFAMEEAGQKGGAEATLEEQLKNI